MSGATKHVGRFWQFGQCVLPQDCQSIIDVHFKPEAAVDAMIGSLTDRLVDQHRKTRLCWVPERDAVTLLLFNHGLIANFKGNWGFDIESSEQAQLGEYGQGGHYDWHVDEEFFNKEKGRHRKVSVVMQLSDPSTYEGGDLLLGYSQKTPASREQGAIVAFPSELMHKVMPVTKGIRYSATVWLNGPLMI